MCKKTSCAHGEHLAIKTYHGTKSIHITEKSTNQYRVHDPLRPYIDWLVRETCNKTNNVARLHKPKPNVIIIKSQLK